MLADYIWKTETESGRIYTGKSDTGLCSARFGLVGVEVFLGVGGDVAHLLLVVGHVVWFSVVESGLSM